MSKTSSNFFLQDLQVTHSLPLDVDSDISLNPWNWLCQKVSSESASATLRFEDRSDLGQSHQQEWRSQNLEPHAKLDLDRKSVV